MVYKPNVPLATDIPSVSQGDLKENFTQLNTLFGIEHTAFNAATDAGKHKYVSFPILGADPVLAANESAIFVEDADRNLYFKRQGGNKIPIISTDAVFSDPGMVLMPGGILIQFGSTDTSGGGPTYTQNFPETFTLAGVNTPAYSVVCTGSRSNSGTYDICIDTGSITATKFKIRKAGGSSINTVYWIAIGPGT